MWHLSSISIFNLNILKLYYLSLTWYTSRFKDSRKFKDFCPSYAFWPWRKTVDFFLPPALPAATTNRALLWQYFLSQRRSRADTLIPGKIQSRWSSAVVANDKMALKIRTPKSELRVSADATSKVPSFWLKRDLGMTTRNHWMNHDKHFKTDSISLSCPRLLRVILKKQGHLDRIKSLTHSDFSIEFQPIKSGILIWSVWLWLQTE